LINQNIDESVIEKTNESASLDDTFAARHKEDGSPGLSPPAHLQKYKYENSPTSQVEAASSLRLKGHQRVEPSQTDHHLGSPPPKAQLQPSSRGADSKPKSGGMQPSRSHGFYSKTSGASGASRPSKPKQAA